MRSGRSVRRFGAPTMVRRRSIRGEVVAVVMRRAGGGTRKGYAKSGRTQSRKGAKKNCVPRDFAALRASVFGCPKLRCQAKAPGGGAYLGALALAFCHI